MTAKHFSAMLAPVVAVAQPAVSVARPTAAPATFLDLSARFRDASARLLGRKLRAQEPFLFLRYGDGALECMAGKRSKTCDGEHYSPDLGRGLRDAWDAVIDSPKLCLGDWTTASFDARSEYSRYTEQYEALIGNAKPKRLHFEALLLMRESEALVDFYRAVREDTRRKLFMGPAANAGAAQLLNAEFLCTPMQGLFQHLPALTNELLRREFDVLLWGAGMASSIPVVKCWQRFPERTYINLGSAMDPLFRGKSRSIQLSQAQAQRLFRGLL